MKNATLFYHATFHSMETESSVYKTLLVEDGVISGVDVDVQQAHQQGASLVDLGGVHVFPALIDAHMHLLDTVALSAVSTSVCSLGDNAVEPHCLAGVEQVVRQTAAQNPSKLLVFSNYIAAAMDEKRLPNRLELDAWTAGGGRVAHGREAWVLNMDGHSSSCSTALLHALGLEEEAPDGILTGAVHDANLGRITDHLASCISPALLGDGIAAFCDDCARYGVGTVCALEGTDDSPQDAMTMLLARLAGAFPIDVRVFPQYMDEKKLARIQRFMGQKRVGGCMRWELDGSVGSRSAAFPDPYADGTQGHLYFETDFLRRKVAGLAQRGYSLTAHAIGPDAIEQLVGIYEQLPAQMGVAALRHRIDHCEFPAKDLVERLIKLKPYVTVQPGYAWVDKRFLHGYEQWLSDQAVQQQIPLRTLAQAGVALCGSSDSPVQPLDPFLQMRGMREFYLPEESLSAYEALKTYTVNGGLMLGEQKGMLACGYEASFFTARENLLDITPAQLEGFHAQSLYLRGKKYQPQRGGLVGLVSLLLGKKRPI